MIEGLGKRAGRAVVRGKRRAHWEVAMGRDPGGCEQCERCVITVCDSQCECATGRKRWSKGIHFDTGLALLPADLHL